MEVAGTALSAIQTILSALQSPHLKKIISIYGYESKLDELQSTVNIINNELRKAQSAQELPDDVQGWIEDLKDVVFEAEDLLDEFVTLAEQNKHLKADGTISKKMKRFLSRSNPFLVAFKMSKGVDKIRKKLDAFAYNKQFIMEFNHEPIKYRKPETCSYVDVAEIIGREGDLEHIVGRLLDSDVQTDVSFLSIVGMGGLGKTALAQLVYSDKRVESAFNLRLWHCVSDQDHKQLNITGILGAILALCTNEKCTDQSSLQYVQSRLQKELSNKKYLLVLDDVWTEIRNQWIELVSLLKVGQKGSWIVVTTRSQVTANFMGYDSMYQLQGLKKEDSWSLFEKVAFSSEQWNHHDDLVEIGQKIVEACGGVPLAIKVAGSLVYGQDKKKWEAVQEVGVANMGNDDITQILKLSYHHLPFSLKNCFSFCAIFPKDYRMEKNTLINLWIAHNYIVPSHKGQSIEDAGEEHFLILLRRCFFQDIEKDVYTGEVDSIKIHDLLHDIAQDVSRKEIFAGSSTILSDNLHKIIRHLSLFNKEIDYEISSDIPRLRSYLDYRYFIFGYVDNFHVEKLMKSCRYLRALRLVDLGIKDLSSLNYVGELLHLRYLDLSLNMALEVLPKSITKLCNLEILLLYGCRNLKELPEDLSRLIKLRVLDISRCSKLKYMPKGMDKLTCLYRLSDFIVGGKDSYSSWSEWFLGLEELKDLKNLHDRLRIKIKWPKNVSQDQIWEGKRFYLRDKKHLNHIRINFDDVTNFGRVLDNEEAIKLMKDLHPPSSLRFFEMFNYVGKQMPEWISHLPNLVNLELMLCYDFEYLECFGNVEERSILPSLQKLNLEILPKLKGWRRGGVGVEDNNNSLLCLPSLKELYISCCDELTCFPVCPRLEELFLTKFNTRLNGIMRRTERDDEESNEVIVLESSKLKHVNIDDVAWLNSLPIQALQRLETTIFEDRVMENLGEVKKVFRACSSFLRILTISGCLNLRSIVAGELEHLSALETLSIISCKNLKFSEEKEENYGVGYNPSILPSLLTLTLYDLLKMEHLPNWMQFLSALQTLEIKSCYRLKAIPNWMPKLTSLKQLHVKQCSKSLERRCKEDPPGEDWAYIQHIPTIQFINCF
ncbi:disease resistance protein RGA2-like [Amaranthus tricolor]|uniref:disease resistance protein RGA2-like n=1 Tax=Amaranthus tricolor TaxID=29722 RepID=UPI0025858631|nr:disease resistance protein RGA2-like [Amaranthus tricolor]XP_057528174.1 disease resistance protein RGA2-like [Amaranthus tricolor]XP_057528175.1 disease resistance protein RGA2-like [Amaranthus tricolor]XP_057528176.1 disease resistance protein RGA2-like [Amaranthus tricolor]XP_057528177.1 disease resistance protein RGA2-like [Amaranthus tricolor]XP_057528178.1 disease resistance protein RGA2-like [Amaranthus tricolor]XP_057528179.1 disease resistance protein RGA2-like [Amaranthus tricolo